MGGGYSSPFEGYGLSYMIYGDDLSKYLCLPPLWWGDILFLSCPSVRHTVCQRNFSETTEQNFMKLGR
jgi:hypothetical protein